MKLLIFIFAGFLLLTINSCKKEVENSLIETETNLKIDIPISVVNSDNTKSGVDTYNQKFSFSGTGAYSMKGIDDVEDELFNVQHVRSRKGSVLSFPISDGNEISKLQMQLGFNLLTNDNFTMQESIDLLLYEHFIENGMFKVNLDEALVSWINSLDNNVGSLKVTLNGEANYNIIESASIDIPVILESGTIIPRFELF
jgi:hypothetical protein